MRSQGDDHGQAKFNRFAETRIGSSAGHLTFFVEDMLYDTGTFSSGLCGIFAQHGR